MFQKNQYPNTNSLNKCPYPSQNLENQCPYPNQNPINQCPYPIQNSEIQFPYPIQNLENQFTYPNQCPTIPEFSNSPQVGQGYPSYPNLNNQYPNFPMNYTNSSQSKQFPPKVPPLPAFRMPTQNNKLKERDMAPSFSIPTLLPDMTANPSTDAYSLNQAFKGFGCNKEAVRNIIARRNCAQREAIKQEYQSIFKKSLIERTKSELTEPYERVIISLLWTGSDLDAFMMYKASKGIGHDESAYRDIICTRSFDQLVQVKASYQKIYNKSLLDVVKSETSGCSHDIFISLLNNPRDQCPTTDFELVKRDAADLFSAKLFKITAPSSLINTFAKRSNMQLLQTFITYKELTGKTVRHYLKQFIPSDYQKCLITIFNFIINPIRYYTKQLKEGLTKQSIEQIIRIVSSRCEIDLFTIIEDYKFKYKTNFAEDFQNVFLNLSGRDTTEAILILIGAK